MPRRSHGQPSRLSRSVAPPLDFGAPLIARWRREADNLRGWGAVTQAEVLHRCASDLEVHLREWELERLTLEQAALETGYSYSALEKKVRRGELENVGGKGRPRVRRRDLPTKARRRPSDHVAHDLAERILGQA